MKCYKKVYAVFYKISKILAYISVIAVLFITVMTTIDVVLRLISERTPLNMFVKGTYESTQLFLILIVFFAYAITEFSNGHVGVSIVTDKLPKTVREIVGIVVNAIEAVFCFILTYVCWLQTAAHISSKMTSSVLFIPFSPFSFCMTVGALLFAISLVLKCINNIISFIKHGDEWEQELLH